MQRGDIEELDITICDEECLPYNDHEAGDDKEDAEWDMILGTYVNSPVRFIYRRRVLYYATVALLVFFVLSMCYWTYEVMYNYSDFDDMD